MGSILSLKGKVWSGYLLAFLLLLISYILIFYTMRRSVQQTNSVAHTYMVINKLEALRGQITEAETGVRGYVISHDLRFLQPYNDASQNIPVIYKELKNDTRDNPAQHVTLDTLIRLLNRRLSYMATGIEDFRNSGFTITDPMKITRETSKKVMDSIRVYVEKAEQNEQRLMTDRKDKLAGFFRSTQIIAIISLAIAFITLIYSVIIFNKENSAKEKAIQKATGYGIELENNIRELKEANAQLEELKSMEKFTATGRIARTIAHEVRNPLTNISLATEQLQDMATQLPDSAVLLEMISRNAGRINQLVADLLNATRFAQLDIQQRNINELLEETLELAKDRIELNHITVKKYYSPESCAVTVDAEKIKLAFLNIIVNAIEAVEKNTGMLELRTQRIGQKCVIEFRDNGKGMTEDVLQNLFEPYFTGKVKGNGLGLTNTQNIIFNHKGTIKVLSKPGQGSTFIVTLSVNAEINNEL
jgi:signal transduction histidine kinase